MAGQLDKNESVLGLKRELEKGQAMGCFLKRQPKIERMRAVRNTVCETVNEMPSGSENAATLKALQAPT